MKKNFIVDDNFSNTRLDRWVRKNISDVPQSLIEKSIRKGNIKVNKKKVKSSYKLKKNDKIFLFNFKFKTNEKREKQNIYIPSKKELSFSSNLFIENNENFAVLNKPAGLAVQQGTKSRRNILDILKKTKEFENYFPYTVHRIDKETTGILIVAKTRKYAQLFTSLFRIRKIYKTYLGIIIGSFEKKDGMLVDELFHYEGDKKIKTKAITRFKEVDSNGKYSLLLLNPETGRKHQLRKQLLLRGCPIFGDVKYRLHENKNKKNNSLMLHAYKISFSINNVRYKFTADPPIKFKSFMDEKYLKIYQ
jgi:23S rRNA pseudouridine955/2504/2580 synthase